MNVILRKIVEHARLGLPLPGHGLDPSEVIRLAVERGISIPAARRLLRKTTAENRKENRMNISTEEFRLKAEAVARGERPTTKAKVKAKAVIPKPKPRKPARLTRAQAERIDNTLTRIEGALCRTWAEAVAFIQKRDKCSASEAGRKACDEFKHLHPTNRRRTH